ncbi:hypothetical protein E2320_002193, partial [Naja naja]
MAVELATILMTKSFKSYLTRKAIIYLCVHEAIWQVPFRDHFISVISPAGPRRCRVKLSQQLDQK